MVLQKPIEVITVVLKPEYVSLPVADRLSFVVEVTLQRHTMTLHGGLRTVLVELFPLGINIGVPTISVMSLNEENSRQQRRKQQIDNNLLGEDYAGPADVEAVHVILQTVEKLAVGTQLSLAHRASVFGDAQQLKCQHQS